MSWLTSRPDGNYPDLDEKYLDQLAGYLGEGPVRELLSDGLIELTDRLGRLKGLAEAGRWDEIAAIAHDMIGVAGHLGLLRLSLAAVDLERAARAGGPPPERELTEVAALAEPALAALSRRVDETGPD